MGFRTVEMLGLRDPVKLLVPDSAVKATGRFPSVSHALLEMQVTSVIVCSFASEWSRQPTSAPAASNRPCLWVGDRYHPPVEPMARNDERVSLPPGKPCEYHGYVVEAILQDGDLHKARVLLARKGEERVVIKELSLMRPLFRALYGRRMLRREARTLHALAGFESAPKLVERISSDAIAIEFVQSHYLPRKLPDSRKARVMKALRRAVEELHERRVVHLDLRQRKNVLVSRENEIVLIDFESSLIFGHGVIGRWLHSRFAAIDRSAVLKWQTHFLPRRLTEEEHKKIALYRGLKKLWVFKRIGRTIRRWFGRE